MPRDRDDDRYDDDDDRPRRRSRRDDDEDEDDRPRRRSRRDDDDYTPPPKSNTGKTLLIVFGILGVVGLVCGGAAFALLFPAFNKVREAAGRANVSNNAKVVSLGSHNVHDVTGRLTPFVVTDAAGMPFDPPANPSDRLSWRVGLLPYIEQESLFRQFKHREAWNSPANQALASTVVKPYTDPADAPNPDTRYRCFYDNGALFNSDPKVRTTFAGITDGTSNTLMYVESTDLVRWTAFNDFKFDPNGPTPALGHPTRDTFMAVMCDGSIRWVKKTVSPQTFKAAVTRAGAEPLGADW